MSDRYKKEIEEILQQAGEISSGKRARGSRPGLLRLVWLQVVQSLGGKTLSFSPGRVMFVAVALLISALITNAIGLGFAGLLGWAGLVLFIVGYALFFVRPSKVEKRWRGQPIEYSENLGDSWWARVRRKLR